MERDVLKDFDLAYAIQLLEQSLPDLQVPRGCEDDFCLKFVKLYLQRVKDEIPDEPIEIFYDKSPIYFDQLTTHLRVSLSVNGTPRTFILKLPPRGKQAILASLIFFETVRSFEKSYIQKRNNTVTHPGLPDEVVKLVERASKSSLPCLILGETGVGKEVVAELIHKYSGRKGEFVAVNCGAIPQGLFENELFGHEPNSFTGSSRSGLMGKLELAHSGTIFLDEIGEIPLYSQAKLLRFIERGEFWKLGATKPTRVDVKIIAATNRPLKELVRIGRFRKDLYYRLKGIEIHIPPLRERREKVEELVRHFLEEFGKGKVSITSKAMDLLKSYNWPGNVRELKYLVQILVEEVARGDITADHVLKHIEKPQVSSLYEEAKRQFELKFILHALEGNNWNVTKTANSIGMSRRWLQLKMKELGITSKWFSVE